MPTLEEWKKIRRWTKAKFDELRAQGGVWSGHNSAAASEAIRLAGEHFDIGHGDEGFCNQSNGKHGITYLNMGDTYDTTIIFRSESERFSIGNWGSIVEAHPERYGE